MKCPDCNGRGFLFVYSCNPCKGSGIVPDPISPVAPMKWLIDGPAVSKAEYEKRIGKKSIV